MVLNTATDHEQICCDSKDIHTVWNDAYQFSLKIKVTMTRRLLSCNCC